MADYLTFRCQKCGYNGICEILYTDILSITPEGDFEYGRPEVLESDGVEYQCAKCGQFLVDEDGRSISGEMELVDYLLAHQDEFKEQKGKLINE
jgi:predicted RNA-binding Zn-ribbon protein involved in translation (DUF1610 family)